jgi:hypothetical protein
VPGTRQRLRLALAALAVLVSLAAATVPASAGRSRERPQPPTAAAAARAEQAFLGSSSASAASASGGAQAAAFSGPLFPSSRLVVLYGAPQLPRSALGATSVEGAKNKIVKQAAEYDGGGRPVFPGFDLIAVVATASPGPGSKYRSRQSPELIGQYLNAAREIGGRLVLDIQPGRASILKETKALRSWLQNPDVDIAIDPEWNVGKRGIPGRTDGSVKASMLNKVSKFMQKVVNAGNLPPKLMVVHQFSKRMVKKRARIKQRSGVQAVLNFDGIGGAAAKVAGYKALARSPFNGFSLFYKLDSGLMSPQQVIGLSPPADYVLYQ